MAFLIGWIARAVGVPTDVRRHDSAIRERDGSLETWIADRHYQLCQDCRRVRETGHGKSLADREIADLKARALHEFRDEAQLLVVTHQKRTMEAGDVLYGVTMQLGGSSRVVSQRVATSA